jgi:hypothetical protein
VKILVGTAGVPGCFLLQSFYRRLFSMLAQTLARNIRGFLFQLLKLNSPVQSTADYKNQHAESTVHIFL